MSTQLGAISVPPQNCPCASSPSQVSHGHGKPSTTSPLMTPSLGLRLLVLASCGWQPRWPGGDGLGGARGSAAEAAAPMPHGQRGGGARPLPLNFACCCWLRRTVRPHSGPEMRGLLVMVNRRAGCCASVQPERSVQTGARSHVSSHR